MNKKYNILFLLVIFTSHFLSAKHAISYSGGSRFGDRVSSYVQARFLSYITKVQFLYRPFLYSNQLQLTYDALPYDQEVRKYRRTFHINSKSTLVDFLGQIRNESTPSTLYILDYFPTDIFEWERTDFTPTYSVVLNYPWHNTEFLKYLKKCIKPQVEIPDLTKPNCLNVALHVRTLSGGDTPETSWANLPLKHPSWDYYERQIEKVYEFNLRRLMHIFIFSDTDNPNILVQYFRDKFKNYDIEFNIQILTNPDTNYVIQDFFAMQKFDVLIATQSNFSMMAAKIGTFDMVIFPVHVRGTYPHLYIDRVKIISNQSEWFPYPMNIIVKD